MNISEVCVGADDRFRAAVSAKPVINWISFVLTADSYNFFSRYWFPDMPWKVPEQYLARSPISFVDRITTPTMLLTGEDDYRTPISESEQFYQALKLRQVDTALVRIPGASHGIASRPSHLIGKVAHVLAWFKRYDASAEPAAAVVERPAFAIPNISSQARRLPRKTSVKSLITSHWLLLPPWCSALKESSGRSVGLYRPQ